LALLPCAGFVVASTVDAGRIAFAVVALAANAIVQTSLGENDNTLAIWVFVAGGLLVGLVIGRWWAIVVALGMLVVGASVAADPGFEDTSSGLFWFIGVFGGIEQAIVICLGVAMAKGLAAMRRRRK